MDAADDRTSMTLYAAAGSVRRRETIIYFIFQYYLLCKPLEVPRNQHGARATATPTTTAAPVDPIRRRDLLFFASVRSVVFPFSRFGFFFFFSLYVLVPFVFNTSPCATTGTPRMRVLPPRPRWCQTTPRKMSVREFPPQPRNFLRTFARPPYCTRRPLLPGERHRPTAPSPVSFLTWSEFAE